MSISDDDVPDGLTPRARRFVGVHGVEVGIRPVEDRWLEHGIPTTVIDRMVTYQQRWRGLLLPPATQYDGGPVRLDPDAPESGPDGWWFDAGPQRVSVPYSFVIGPSGEFGLRADRWTPLHATVEGWVESLALAHEAFTWARQITRYVGDEVDGIDLNGYEPVVEVHGLADTWWRGADSLVALYTGEAECLDFPEGRTALIYSGLRGC